MKHWFGFGLLLGFGGLIAAAGWYPWVQHASFPSNTLVVPNGGRAERFVIRLPADRIAMPTGLAGDPAPDGDPSATVVEHFKLRDTAGRIIGTAARHSARVDAEATTAWLVAIPSRGALMLADATAAPDGVAGALAAAGYTPGAAWQGDITVELVDSGDSGQFSAGTREFDDLDVRFSELWSLTGVDANGTVQGTIELATVSRRGS